MPKLGGFSAEGAKEREFGCFGLGELRLLGVGDIPRCVPPFQVVLKLRHSPANLAPQKRGTQRAIPALLD